MIGRIVRTMLGHADADDVHGHDADGQVDDDQTAQAGEDVAAAEAVVASLTASIEERESLKGQASAEVASVDEEIRDVDAEQAALAPAAFRGSTTAREQQDVLTQTKQALLVRRERAELARVAFADDLSMLVEQRDVAQQLLMDQQVAYCALQLKEQGQRTAVAADAFRRELEKFITADDAASAAAQRAGYPIAGSALADRLVFALSFHLLSETVLHGLRSTQAQLTVSHARARGGLGFTVAAVRPFSPPDAKDDDAVAVAEETTHA